MKLNKEILWVGNVLPTKARDNPNQGRAHDLLGACSSLNCKGGRNLEAHIIENERVRKMTPLECFRLMGFTDEDFFKVQKALNETFYKGRDRSNSQLYKIAGNSIIVPMLEYLFCQMFDDKNEIWV